MKKRFVIILSVAAVSILSAIGIFAGIAAQSSDDDRGKRSFTERVASILGLEASDVEDAFAQAREEIREEDIGARLSKLVEDGELTQDESEAIQTWLEMKPDVELTLMGKRGWGGKSFGGYHDALVLADDKLEYLVEKGALTRADADALSGWYDNRPDAITKLVPNRSGWKGDAHDGWRGKKGRWGSGRWSANDRHHPDVNDDA